MSNKNPIQRSFDDGKVVFWEEIARDGAQAKTLLNATQRIKIAKNHANIFEDHAKEHLIYAVGFPTIGKMEFETIRAMVDAIDECSLVTHGRTTRRDVDLALEAIEGAALPRVSFFFPVSDQMCRNLMRKTPAKVLAQSLEVINYAADLAGSTPIDIALADAARADASFLDEVIGQLATLNVNVVKLCDSIGCMYPAEASNLFGQVVSNKPDNINIGCHMHNDFGFAQSNNFEALKSGVNLIATSWLGLAERNGLQPTEQMLFLLGNNELQTSRRLGLNMDAPFYDQPNLKYLYPTALKVSKYTAVPMTMTHGIVGPGINSLSTGTPFTHVETFQPFDPYEVLGIAPKVYVTQLASRKLVDHVARSIGYQLSSEALDEVVEYVKSEPYRRSSPILSIDELRVVIDWKVGHPLKTIPNFLD